jgi:hypothetical protein
MDNKKEFTITVDDKEIVLAAVRPSYKVQNQASLLRTRTFAEAVKSGSILRTELDHYMKDRGMWDEEKQKQLEQYDNKINELTLKLKKGGIKLSDGRSIALEIKKLRGARRDLLVDRTSLDSNTAEGQSENESLNYLVSRCIVYNDSGEPYFKTYEEFLENRNNTIARAGFSAYIELISDISLDFENTLPENNFLRKYKFIDEKGRFINKEGKLVDVDGRLVDEKGRWVNTEGKYVDKDGNLIDDDGNYLVESEPFLDDDGNPV